jgi:hypothetical protein
MESAMGLAERPLAGPPLEPLPVYPSGEWQHALHNDLALAYGVLQLLLVRSEFPTDLRSLAVIGLDGLSEALNRLDRLG